MAFGTLLLATLLRTSAGEAASDRDRFETWKVQWNRSYDSVGEETTRFDVFQSNLRRYEQLNRMGRAIYAPDDFADFTVAEFLQLRSDPSLASADHTADDWWCQASSPKLSRGDLHAGNKSIDWRQHGAVTPVKDQGPLGVCWAFCTVGIMEGANVVQGGNKLQSLSEQELADCTITTSVCDCGSCVNSYYKKHHYAADTEESYPYTGIYGGSCKRSSGVASTAQAKGTICVANGEDGNQDDILDHLLRLGPAGFIVSSSCLMGYKSGIISTCGMEAGTDHATTLVGAGEDHGTPYWLVKNSWGASFGEDGYFRVQRNTHPPQLGTPGGIFAVFGATPPTPAPSPSDHCHAVDGTVSDAWCEANCHASPPNCPENLCECGPGAVLTI